MKEPGFEHLPPTPSTEEGLQRLIDDEVEESLQLDYKRAASLGGTQQKKVEVTKDVSAMANADGGRIIYGIAEFNERDRAHLPERLDPVDRRDFSKERLDQVIGNIRPRIDVRITAVPISTGENDVVYVVDIPKGSTAHQAQDKRYYKRYNFRSVPMNDYEVRDVMGRLKHPQLALTFEIDQEFVEPSGPYAMARQSRKPKAVHRLEVTALNEGMVVAEHVIVRLRIPTAIVDPDELHDGEAESRWVVRTMTNSARDVVSVTSNALEAIPNYGPVRSVPILPHLGRTLRESVTLHPRFPMMLTEQVFEIPWSLHADAASPAEGTQMLTLDFYEECVGG